MSITAEKLAAVYIKIRDKRSELKREFELVDKDLKEQQAVLEHQMLEICKDSGADSLKTKYGTITRSVKSRFWATDWHEFHKFVLENQALDMLERRVAQGAVKQWMSEQEDGTLPPGINVDSEYAISVRKPSNK